MWRQGYRSKVRPEILPTILPCKCGDIGVTVKPRGGRWAVYCLRPACDCYVRGFATEVEAIAAWNKEVKKE
jgi:hypothetical protein